VVLIWAKITHHQRDVRKMVVFLLMFDVVLGGPLPPRKTAHSINQDFGAVAALCSRARARRSATAASVVESIKTTQAAASAALGRHPFTALPQKACKWFNQQI
jgi:hypothetical protein